MTTPADRLELTRVCVFCGSRPGERPAYVDAARRTGEALADAGIEIVYGGSSFGIMGAMAHAAMGRGGRVLGVIPESLMEIEAADPDITDLKIVGTMHERKALMSELSDAFIALPGGLGTLEEFCEILTWSQLGIQRKPHGVLNIEGFWQPLINLLDHMVTEGFVLEEDRALIVEEDDPVKLIERLREPRPEWAG